MLGHAELRVCRGDRHESQYEPWSDTSVVLQLF